MSEYKTVDVPPDQSYETETLGENKFRWCRTRYFWHGNIWGEIARQLAKSNMPIFIMNTFIGAVVNQEKHTIAIRGGFTREVFLTKYSPRLITNPFFHDLEKLKRKKEGDFDPYEDSRIWRFTLSGKRRIRLPSINEKNDELSYHVNGFPLSDMWDEWTPEHVSKDEQDEAA